MRAALATGIGVIVIAAGAWWWMMSRPAALPSAPAPDMRTASVFPVSMSAGPEAMPSGPLKSPRTPPAGEAEYRSLRYRFSLFYPTELSVKEYDEGGGGETITFQNVAAAHGFQIFIVPYTAPQVSTTRFKQDEPSGVLNQPVNVFIDGAQGTAFFSTDAILRDTAEIWFISGGYLFEVTAPKPLASWLSQIMQTWQFI